jgi:hypothetical protein
MIHLTQRLQFKIPASRLMAWGFLESCISVFLKSVAVPYFLLPNSIIEDTVHHRDNRHKDPAFLFLLISK